MDPAMAIEAAALAQQQAMLDALAQGDSEVQRFYKNCVVFITGGTGFLGKQLIEKLFRSCDISKIYLLLRAKKGKNVKERIQGMINDPVFDTLKQQQPNFVDKLLAIEGDVGKLRLGIQQECWESLIEEVDIIIHGAATTRFDEPLHVATLINVRGTREALLFGKACKKLRSYIHISTAYSHATSKRSGDEVREEFYTAPVAPEIMISMAENIELERLIDITPELTKDWPNTYAFTKAITEELIRTTSGGLPICIVRPAIVLCTYLEPSPGWLDKSCIYGVTGLILGSGLGLIHVQRVAFDLSFGFIPCDIVNNAIIALGKEASTNQTKGGDNTRIYNISPTQRNPITFRKIKNIFYVKGKEIPSPRCVYYGFALYTTNKLLFAIASLFLHVIPAYIADFVCLLIGKQKRFAKLAKKLYTVSNTFSYFSCNEWHFRDSNLEKLYNGLSEQDKAIFNFDIAKINWDDYFMILCVGLRKYIIKDGLKDTAYAIKKQKYLRLVHYIVTCLYVFLIWKTISLIVYIGLFLF